MRSTYVPSVCLLIAGLSLCLASCRLGDSRHDDDLGYFRDKLTSIEYPDLETPAAIESLETPAPYTLSSNHPQDYRPLSLQEAVQTALANSVVLRDVGGLVMNAPDALRTRLGPALAETDPRFGPEAALSEFDSAPLWPKPIRDSAPKRLCRSSMLNWPPVRFSKRTTASSTTRLPA
ncbi:MAG: hypothetical protein MUF06_09485 [Pirellulaceae bacterium]|nr:hypothetical protein [Pirellulaceae bacterium]